MKAIVNAKIITGSDVLEDKALLYDEKIRDIIPAPRVNTSEYEVTDADGLYLSPGFIDTHKHGAYGYDFMDADNGEAAKLLRRLPETGVTSLYPTTMTMPFSDIRRAVSAIGELMRAGYPGASVLGCHMEGPFISSGKNGAQPQEYIKAADYSLIEGLEDIIKLVTIAPEVPGSADFISKCLSSGIRISAGHTMADYDEAAAAFAEGVSSVTHTFCGMRGFHHRDPGILCAAAENPDVFCELIADNIHVHPAAGRLLFKLKGSDRIVLVTDSIRSAGMGFGESYLAGQRVITDESGARLENGALAGSVLALNDAALNFKLNNSLSMAEAVKPVTASPAKRMGIYGQKGVISVGADADLVLIDENIRIYKTITGGTTAYAR